MKTILVPFDFGPAAECALAWAAEMARKEGARIHLLHVIDVVMTATPAPVPVTLTAEDIRELEDALRRAAERAGTTADVTVEIATSPGDRVVEVARRLHADLVVMGTRGRSGVARLLLGSVAEHVVRHAPCPVVTMRDAAAAA